MVSRRILRPTCNWLAILKVDLYINLDLGEDIDKAVIRKDLDDVRYVLIAVFLLPQHHINHLA